MSTLKPKVTGDYIQVPLGELSPNPNNPKLDLADPVAKSEYAKLLRSLTNLGLYAPLLVAQHPGPGGGFYVVNGNHRLKALRELGWEDGTFVECRNLGKLTPAEALAFVVAEEDVKIPIDRIELDLQLKALADADGIEALSALMPYGLEELAELVNQFDDWSTRDLVQVDLVAGPEPKAPDPNREAEGKPYLTLYPDELEYLQKNFKRVSGKFVLNGSKIVAQLKGETRVKK
jgi:ParB-like chromosome segregation protein Spo0J